MYTLENLTQDGVKSISFQREQSLTTTATAELIIYLRGIRNYVWYKED